MAPASVSPRRTMPAVAIPLAVPVGERVIQCAVVASTAWLSTQAMAIEFPKISLPKLPKLSLPGFGEKEAAPAATKPKPKVSAIGVKVRAAATGPTAATADAPTLAEITGKSKEVTIGSGQGWNKFPARRMPGANMDRWKEISKEITPDV